MQTIYNYLSEAGWAWFALVAVALGAAYAFGWRPLKNVRESDQSHEQ